MKRARTLALGIVTASMISTATVGLSPREEPSESVSGCQPLPSDFSNLPPRLQQTIKERAKSCFVLPDGKIIDASAYYQFRSAIQSCFSLTTVTGKPGRRWRVDDSDEAWAWGFIRGRGLRPDLQEHPSERARPAMGIYRSDDLDAAPRPPVAIVESGGPEVFTFIDEDRRDVVVAKMSQPHYALIRQALADGFVRVELKAIGQQLRPANIPMMVHLPAGMSVPKEYLPGRFLLVENKSIPNPDDKSGQPKQRRSYWDTVHEFIPLDKEATPEQVYEAVRAGRLRAVTWTWERAGDSVVWTQTNLLEAPPQPHGKPAAPRKPATKK